MDILNNLRSLKEYYTEISNRHFQINTESIYTYDDLIMCLINSISYLITNSSNQQPNPQTNTINNEDILYLLSNSKQIEKLLLDNKKQKNDINDYEDLFNNDPTQKSNSKYNFISKESKSNYEEKIFILEKEIQNLKTQKKSLEKNFLELKNLISQFDNKYSSITTTLFDENLDVDEDTNKNKYMKMKINSELSQQIYTLYMQKLFNESCNIWKKYCYQPLCNLSIERSYEILVYYTKLKDRQMKKIINNGNESSNDESKKKNCEIVELLSNIEFYKYKLDETEVNLNDIKNRYKNLIDANNDLFIENRKLKNIIEDNK